MNLEERVTRGLGEESNTMSEWARARKAREEKQKQAEQEALEQRPYEPGVGGSPLWEPTPEEQSVKLPKPKPAEPLKTGAFTIDTTTSFLGGMPSATTEKAPEKAATPDTSKEQSEKQSLGKQ